MTSPRKLTIVPVFPSACVALCLSLLGGCAGKAVMTFQEVEEFSRYSNSYYSGTPKLWENASADARKSGKPRVAILDHGERSLALRINLIRSARKSISIQTFDWAFDESGKTLIWELIRANRDRGIEVRILVDHMFSDHDPEIISYLSSLGPSFQLKYFNPSANRLSPSLLDTLTNATVDFHEHNSRMHNKLFVMDDLIAITGGRNISNQYFDQSIGMNYKDRDVLVVLPEGGELSSILDLYWNDVHSISSSRMIEVSRLLKMGKKLRDLQRRDFCRFPLFEEIEARANDTRWVKETFLTPSCEVRSVDWVYDLPGKVKEAPVDTSPVSIALTQAILAARGEIVIQSPYFVLSENAQEVFSKIREELPQVRVIVSTNSLAATDNWATYAAHYKEKRVYLDDLGLEMWEFKPVPKGISGMMNYGKLLARLPLPGETQRYGEKKFRIQEFDDPPSGDLRLRTKAGSGLMNPYLKVPPYLSLHAKSLVVDGNISYVGSYNLDPRSDSYNTEVGLLIVDAAFSARLRESIMMDASPANSYLIGAKKRKPVLSALNRLFNLISEKIPLWDPWPIRSHTSFRLREGKSPVPEGNPDFYANWENAGNFPGLSLWAKKQISTSMFKAAGMILKPLL